MQLSNELIVWYHLQPTWQPVSIREGSEPDLFWEVLDGKSEYQKGKEAKGPIEDPHLFVLNISEGISNA